MRILASSLATVLVSLLAFSSGAALAADGKGVTITAPWVRATPGGSNITAAFMQITSDAGDTLVAAKSDAAGRVEVHTHIMDGDVMKMRRVDKLEIAKGTPRVLKPMSDHIMLMDVKQPLKEGDTVKMTLTFEKAGDVTVEAPVQPVGASGPKEAGKAAAPASGHDHHSGH